MATTAGLNALRRALELLLQDREPASTLSADLAPRILTVPGSDWQAVIHAVMDGLLSQRADKDGDAISSAFNALAGVIDVSSESSNGKLGKVAVPSHADIETTDDATASTFSAPVDISIIAPEARTLRVIKEIPGFRLCQLEAEWHREDSAARLLELVSGAQPYSTLPHAWSTLKQQLGPTTITVNGLTVGRLQFTLTPSVWPEQANDSLGDSLGKVTLNGEKIESERSQRFPASSPNCW